jgi:hypothetical protein
VFGVTVEFNYINTNFNVFFQCSLIGATVIVIGFYSVLWGKSKDIEARSLESSGNQTPLLKENISEDI